MPIIKPGPYDKARRDLEDNFDALKDHVEDVDFKRWLPARVWNTQTIGGGGAAVEGCYVASPFWELPDAVTSSIVTQQYRPQYWLTGSVGGTIYYTGDAGSTNNIRLTTRITGFLVNGTALTTATGDATTALTQSIPGPAVADELLTYDIPSTGWFSLAGKVQYPYLAITLTRLGADGADTYAGDARILGVMLRFYWTRR